MYKDGLKLNREVCFITYFLTRLVYCNNDGNPDRTTDFPQKIVLPFIFYFDKYILNMLPLRYNHKLSKNIFGNKAFEKIIALNSGVYCFDTCKHPKMVVDDDDGLKCVQESSTANNSTQQQTKNDV